jgi:hypothetical protein
MAQENYHNIILTEKKSSYKTQVLILLLKESVCVCVSVVHIFRRKRTKKKCKMLASDPFFFTSPIYSSVF